MSLSCAEPCSEHRPSLENDGLNQVVTRPSKLARAYSGTTATTSISISRLPINGA